MKFITQTAAVALLAAAATAPSLAQTHAGNVTIDGSLCVGFDCAATETFGFDTIMLKENNLRIFFDDTSSTASFPANDWRLVANDSTNGGDSHFSIQDATAGNTPFRVMAGAGANAFHIDAQGEVGINTGTPVLDLHIADGNTPGIRLEQTSASGFTPQTWDVAGNEANFFIRDATGGSQLPFRIQPGADSNTLYIASDNEIGFGTSSPQADLHLRRTTDDPDMLIHYAGATASARDLLTLRNNGVPRLLLDNTDSGDEWEIAGGNQFYLDNNVSGVRVMKISDGGDVTIPGDLTFEHAASGSEWDVIGGNRFVIDHSSGGGTRVFKLDSSGNIEIPGTITTGGGTCGGGCDAVFEADYPLPSIVEHAEQMWELGYLPNVGPTIENEPINLSDKVGRMLNELETAHIYIAELHERVAALEAERAAQ